MMDIDVKDAPDLSRGGAQPVPSRISVVLTEEAIAGDTPRLGWPCDEQSERLLAGVAQPAKMIDVCWGDAVPFQDYRS